MMFDDMNDDGMGGDDTTMPEQPSMPEEGAPAGDDMGGDDGMEEGSDDMGGDDAAM